MRTAIAPLENSAVRFHAKNPDKITADRDSADGCAVMQKTVPAAQPNNGMEHLNFSDPVLLLMIAALAWFMRTKMGNYDEKHDKHFDEIRNLQAGAASMQQQIDDHDKRDEDRFNRMEEMFRETRDDIKELLRQKK